MPVPLIAWLMLGGLVVAAATSKKKRPKATVWRPPKVNVWRPGQITDPAAIAAAEAFVETFGTPTANDYPAPYRYSDAKKIAGIVLQATSENSPKAKRHYDEIRERFAAIDAAPLPNWRKTYAVIMTVVFPAYAANLFWWWWRPREPLKEARFNAIATWAVMFFTLPETATSAPGIEAHTPGSSLFHSMGPYLDPNIMLHRGDLDALQMRRALYDIYAYLNGWGRATSDPDAEWYLELEGIGNTHLANLKAAYPLSDPLELIIEGNFAMVSELLWWVNARVQESIQVNFDEGTAWALLVVQVVAAVVSAVAPWVSPAVGAAIAAAATAVQAVAMGMAAGGLSTEQAQALGGASAAYVLDKASIELGLKDEMAQVETLVGQTQETLG